MKDWMTILAAAFIIIAGATLAAVLLWRWLLAIGLIAPVEEDDDEHSDSPVQGREEGEGVQGTDAQDTPGSRHQ